MALRALCAHGHEGATGKAIERQVRRRQRTLAGACPNLSAVQAALERYLQRPPRSSSAVEAFNARIRVAQQVHRQVSDEHLALLAWSWNARPRHQGPHTPAPSAAQAGRAGDLVRPGAGPTGGVSEGQAGVGERERGEVRAPQVSTDLDSSRQLTLDGPLPRSSAKPDLMAHSQAV